MTRVILSVFICAICGLSSLFAPFAVTSPRWPDGIPADHEQVLHPIRVPSCLFVVKKSQRFGLSSRTRHGNI